MNLTSFPGLNEPDPFFLYVFAVDAVYFALLLYAFERYLRDRVWIFLLIAVVLVAAGMSFNLYLYALFFLPYSLFRFYVCYGWQPKAWLRFSLTMVGLVVLGIGISAVFMFANVQEMINSPRVLGDVSFFGRLMDKSLLGFEGYVHNITAVMRLFSSDLLGTGSEFQGWRNYLEAPMFYCGLLPLLLAPQVFVQLDRKHKTAYALFGLVFLVPVIMPFFRYLLWAFTGDYYRLYSAFVALVILFFSLQALNFIFKTGKINVRLLMATLVLLLLMLLSPYFWAGGAMFKAFDTSVGLVVTGLLLLYTALVIALASNRFRSLAQWGLLLVVCVELAGFSWQTVNDRPVVTAQEFEAKTGYNDYSNEAVAAIKKKDPGFYRIDKTYGSGPAIHTSLNDAMIQGYFGTSSYHSFNQLNYIRFLVALEIIDDKSESATRWAFGMLNNPLLTSFASVKYVLVNQNSRVQMFKRLGYRLVYEQGGVFVMMNPSYLPFGFTYDSYMNEDEFLSMPVQLKSIALMKTAVIGQSFDKTGYSQLAQFDQKRIEPAYNAESYRDDIKQRRASFLKINSFDHNHVYGQIESEQPKLLFFTLPFDRGWSATVDGEPAELLLVNIGFSGLLLPAGKHIIELNYHLPYFTASLVVSIISLYDHGHVHGHILR